MKIFIFFATILCLSNSYAQEIHAIGRMEKFNFEFHSKNPLELSRDCMVFAQNERIAHIDDIYVSFNQHKRLHLHNQEGVWHYPRHFCHELEKVAQAIDLTPPAANDYRELEAIINHETYRFSGSHQAEIFNDCIAQLENHAVEESDHIKVHLNSDQPWIDLRNNDSWWRGAQQICNIIDQAVFHSHKNYRAPAL